MDSSSYLLFLGFGVVAFVLVIGAIAWQNSRSRQILEKWAETNGYQLLNCEYQLFNQGPFFWTTARGQVVYRVTVREAQGRERAGWVRLGSWWWGLWSDQVKVRWDD